MALPAGLRRHGDLAIAVVLALLFVVEVVLWEGAELSGAIPGCLLASLPLALRRTQPLPAFLLVAAGVSITKVFAPGIDNGSLTFIAIFFVALYSLGAHTRGREVWVSGVLVVVGIVLFALTDGDSFHPGDVVFATALVGGPWAAGLALRLRRDTELRLREHNVRLRLEQEALALRAVADERARIARELHDVVSHAISVTVLQARGARRALGDGPPEVREALDAIEHTNTQALGDMRRLLAVLRDTESDTSTGPQPSLDRIGALLDDVRRSGVAVELVTTGTKRNIPPGVDLSAYRIVQESLTNVLKHAAGGRAHVVLDFGESALAVSVRDDGQEPSASPDRVGHGLIGIRERVAVVGGEVAAGPRPEGGFEMRAVLPYSLESS